MRVVRFLGHHALGASFVLIVAVATLFGVRAALSANLGVTNAEVALVVPTAPRLTAATPDERVYRIDPVRSEVRYEASERLVGTERTAVGRTHGIAGDLVVDDADATRSRLGEIVVDLEQLTSDDEMRDRRMRVDFLESTRYPMARFAPTRLDGLPAVLVDDTDHVITITGDLTVRETTAPVVVAATVRRSTDDEILVTADTTVSLRAFGVGPVSLAGMVEVADAVTLRFDVVAVPESRSISPTVAGPGRLVDTATDDRAGGGVPVSYRDEVEPILETSCASCHEAGGIGSHVLELATAEDARAVASGLRLATSSGFMPPWPASDVGVALAHDPSLSADQIDAIARWADAGAPLDVDGATPIEAPAEASGPTIRVDRDLAIPEPYQGSTDIENDYRCFLLDPQIDRETWLTGFRFVPDQVADVHHGVVFHVDASMRDAVAATDAGAPGSGWPCFAGSAGVAEALNPSDGGERPSRQFTAWAPGQGATTYPAGSGLRMDAHDFFVLQVHYHVAHDPPPDRSRLEVELHQGPPLDDISVVTYHGPAEIPCRADETGPLCDRATMLDQLATEYGPAARLIPDALLAQCGQRAEDVAAMTDGTARATCDIPVRRAGEILNLFVHEHEIGRTIRLTLNPGRADERILVDVPAWDFGWQLLYEPAEPIEIDRDDVVRIECTWDRSLLRSTEPRYIAWSEGSKDEMCYSFITTRNP